MKGVEKGRKKDKVTDQEGKQMSPTEGDQLVKSNSRKRTSDPDKEEEERDSKGDSLEESKEEGR